MDHLKGKLYLIPVGLGGENPQNLLPSGNSAIIETLDEFVVENIRSARRFLRSTGYKRNFDTVTFHTLDKHTRDLDIPGFLSNLNEGKDLGLLSEAGNPCIADPGNKVVKLAHENNIRVIPLVGPSSILMALIASGFNGQSFTFHGYLPLDKKARQQKIRELQDNVLKWHQTQIFMETPYRNNALIADLLSNCQDSMLLCMASEISMPDEFIKTLSIAQWKKQTPDLHKKPSVFLLYKQD